MQIKPSRFEKDPYNSYQNFLYNRALHGLSIYTPEELADMTALKKKRITKTYKKTQKILNILKQERTNTIANDIFLYFFPKMEITNCLVDYYGVSGDTNHVNTLTFKDLKIKKANIISTLIQNNILPKNFTTLIPKNI
jgi:hypothetical protein